MITCVSPTKFYQPYLKRDIVSNCGKCPVCSSNKADRNTNVCFQMERNRKYTMFFTLTYDEFHCPRAAVVSMPVSETHCYCRFISVCQRKNEYGNILCDKLISYKDLNSIYEQVGTIGYIPYCSTRDMQLFLKRFRRHLYKLVSYNEKTKIDYFMVSEYGNEHFRPHLHGLFAFDSIEVLRLFRKTLHKAWSYGYINTSLSRGGASSYVSHYINSLSNIPSLFKERGLHAKSLHSKGLLQLQVKEKVERIITSDYRKLVRNGLLVDGKVVPFNGSFASYIFPKCKGFISATNGELYQLYTIARSCKLFLMYQGERFTTLMDVAKQFAYYLRYVPYCDLPAPCRVLYRQIDLTLYYNAYDKLVNCVYQMLCLSNHFLNVVCGGVFNKRLFKLRISQIKEFWYCVSQYQLEKWYNEVNDYLLQDSPFVLFQYDNFVTKKYHLDPCIFVTNSKVQKCFFKYLDSFDVVPFTNFNLKRVNDTNFNLRFSASLVKLYKHLKHVQLNDKILNY